jgi:LmbE family N-acetylglucosaminyl deacetylase
MNILAVSPHTDDIEFACGGAINRWVKEGAKVYGVSFSCGSADKEEFFASSKCLQIDARLLDYPVRNFTEHRQSILDELIRIERSVAPDVVLIPASTDTHQDHQVIREEGFRAFKRHTLLGYEMPQNNLSFQTNAFVKLNRDDIMAKCEALSRYRSQANRPYISREFIESLARVRGMQAGCEYAEAFEVVRWMI